MSTPETLRQCRKCRKIELLPDHQNPPNKYGEIIWLAAPQCFIANLAVSLCYCPDCEKEMETRTE